MKERDDGQPSAKLGVLIEERRRAAGLTQRALAECSGVSVGAIRDLEQGRTSWPRSEAAQRLAEALGLDQQHLTRLAGPPPGDQRPRSGREPAQDVRLAVLGPLVARRDGMPLDLGAERQRGVLVLLALSAGRPVHRATIIDAIWGEAPAPSAVSMVQSYVSRLRDALETGAREPGRRDGLLTSVGESYLLRLGAEQLDALEFGALAARARERAAAGDAAGTCELYARALRLWRGEAAADVGLLRGHPAVAALARQRTAVVLEYAQVALGAGWHGRVLEPLQALADREPLDERAHAALMIALGATGQQAAALRVFDDARARLDQELGVTPGPELAEAHLRILRGGTQPTIKAAAEQAPVRASLPEQADGNPRGRGPERARPPGTVLPRQLPSAVRLFAGREAELKALWEVLDQAGERPGAVVISAIGGMAGVGKTALAVHWAQQAAGRFPDGQLFADLRGVAPAGEPADPARVIGWFLASLGVPAAQVPADPQAQAALLRSVLAGKRMLIVLDNAADAGQVRPLLPGSPGCLVLVTSRTRLTGLAAADGATVLDLDVLDTHEATELLGRRLDRGRLAADPAAVDELAELCGRLPLALAITAARAAARPAFSLAQLAAELRDEANRLDALDTGDTTSSVRQVFSWSYRQLSDQTARMFRLLGVHPGPDISAVAFASLAGVSPAAARRALAELTSAHLLAEPSPGRYALHDLLRAYATELAAATDPEPDRHAAIGRTLDHYLHTAVRADGVLNPLRLPITLGPLRPDVRPERPVGSDEAMAWFEAEHQVLLATVTRAADSGFDTHVWQLTWALADFLQWTGQWDEWAAIESIALAAASRSGDTPGQIVTHRNAAAANAKFARYDEARTHLTACLELCHEIGDQASEALARQSLGIVAEFQGRYPEGLFHAEQALALFRAIGDRAGQAGALNSVGWFCALLGHPARGLPFCQESLALHDEIGDRYSKAHTWDSLGFIERELGNFASAIDCHRRAIELFRECGDRYEEAKALVHLGDTQHAAGKTEARRTWRQAQGIFDDLGHPDSDQVMARLADEQREASVQGADAQQS